VEPLESDGELGTRGRLVEIRCDGRDRAAVELELASRISACCEQQLGSSERGAHLFLLELDLPPGQIRERRAEVSSCPLELCQ